MVSNPGDVPPAFRRKRPGPSFIGMTDDQVIKVAASALNMVQALPVGSEARAGRWAAFDAAMGELGKRAVVHALAKVHGLEAAEDDDGA